MRFVRPISIVVSTVAISCLGRHGARVAPSAQTASPVASGAAGAQRSDSRLPDETLLEARPEDGRRPAPEAVRRESADFDKAHEELPALNELPDFLSVDNVLASVPAVRREDARESIHRQFSGRERDALRGDYLDSDERHFLIWVSSGLDQDVAVFNRNGQRTDRLGLSRATPYMRDVLELETAAEVERGTFSRELVVARVTSASVCCLPYDLEIYAINRQGKIRRLIAFPYYHVDWDRNATYEFMNRFVFHDDNLTVRRIYPENTLPSWEFVYDRQTGHYQPTQNTARRLRKERAENAE